MAAFELGWARYNPDIIAQECSRCGAGSNQRCKGPRGWVPAHFARITAAGYKWATATNELIRLPRQEEARHGA